MDGLELISKNIIYSDTVLSLNQNYSDFEKTTVFNISEYCFKNFLNTILESNQDVDFSAVLYSKKNERVCFYTNKEINLNVWKQKIKRIYISSSDILETCSEIENILVSDLNKDSKCISLYDVSNLMKDKECKYQNICSSFRVRVTSIMYSNIMVIRDFDYNKNELSIGVEGDYQNNKIIFSKRINNSYLNKIENLFVKEDPTCIVGMNILATSGNNLSNIYDEFLKYKDFRTHTTYRINTINSRFLVDIDKLGVKLYLRSIFAINSYNRAKFNDYYCHHNSDVVFNAIDGKEKEIFKRIFIRIDDLPEWCKPILYEKRKNQLLEQEKIENEIKNKEEKKQKRLELKRKLFPFLNK